MDPLICVYIYIYIYREREREIPHVITKKEEKNYITSLYKSNYFIFLKCCHILSLPAVKTNIQIPYNITYAADCWCLVSVSKL